MASDNSRLAKQTPRRSAGILMHITSLSGPPYTGDIGAASTSFADFLNKSGQSVWQILPINPTTAEQGFSPYSSSSAMATNSLLLSMDWLVEKKLIDAEELEERKSIEDEKADFAKATAYKHRLLNVAWRKMRGRNTSQEFEAFCEEEKYWLDDYALYAVLKENYKNAPWYEWPAPLRDRNAGALQQFRETHDDEIKKVKWIQMLFHQQWHELKSYCNAKDIQLMGDIPMYVAHDSADVWSNRDIFTLLADGSLSEVSGVPPDLFNDEGQLWGTPLFRWDVLKETRYAWWINRFRKNFSLFDMVRLDHFRGFSAYWAVAATAKTAKEGEWRQGPGAGMFHHVRNSLGDINLIAEDLGEIDEPVYTLRDALALPGMNVLQFAFNADMLDNNYLPHHHVSNSVVYTGTHDNNTTKGWFNTLCRGAKKHLRDYLGRHIQHTDISTELCRLAYQSVAQLAILPMQDILSLNESSRMNMPATSQGNWTWRVRQDALTTDVQEQLAGWVELFGRDPNKKLL